MSAADTNAILNQVIVLLSRSLPSYLSDARPWRDRAGDEVAETVAAIVSDQQHAAERLAEYVQENDGFLVAGEYPMSFTALHDLSGAYCVRLMINRQRSDIQFLEQAVAALERSPMAKSLVEETLGLARGHLEALEELDSSPTSRGGAGAA